MNVTADQVNAFRRQVEIIPMIGEMNVHSLLETIVSAAAEPTEEFDEVPLDVRVPTLGVTTVARLVQDPAGYFIIYPDFRRRCLRLEHFQNDGSLDCVLEGPTPDALYAAAIGRQLISRLDHAAYLGRELARAERSLETGEPYVQDRAAGEMDVDATCRWSAPKCGPCPPL